jgi:hypothetical protein
VKDPEDEGYKGIGIYHIVYQAGPGLPEEEIP